MKTLLFIATLLGTSSNLFANGNVACDDVLNQLAANGSTSSLLTEACSPIDDTRSCSSECLEKVQEILSTCENEVFDFGVLVDSISCYDWDVCSSVTGIYGTFSSTLCPVDESALECGKPCVDIINLVESACVETSGNMPPEIFLDSLFGHPGCQQLAFSKAIQRSSGCDGWASNHPVRFKDVCADECTDECIAIIELMMDRCDVSPLVFQDFGPWYSNDALEDLGQAYSGVCQNPLIETYVKSRGVESLANFTCDEITSFYGMASGYLCPLDSATKECGEPCVDIINTLESACKSPDGYLPPEIMLDSKFGHPACQQFAFSKAIDGSKFCGDWTEIQSVGFDYLCAEECTNDCVTVIENTFDQCEPVPEFVVEMVPYYNADCQKAFACLQDPSSCPSSAPSTAPSLAPSINVQTSPPTANSVPAIEPTLAPTRTGDSSSASSISFWAITLIIMHVCTLMHV